MDILITLLIGAFIGYLAGLLWKGGGFGIIGNIIIGILGCVAGGILFRLLGLGTPDNLLGVIITGVIGAVVLLALINFAVARR